MVRSNKAHMLPKSGLKIARKRLFHIHMWTPGRQGSSLFIKVKVIQWCPTLCDPLDYTVHEILQDRILELVDFTFSRGSSQPRTQTQVVCIADGFFTSWATREGSSLFIFIIFTILSSVSSTIPRTEHVFKLFNGKINDDSIDGGDQYHKIRRSFIISWFKEKQCNIIKRGRRNVISRRKEMWVMALNLPTTLYAVSGNYFTYLT